MTARIELNFYVWMKFEQHTFYSEIPTELMINPKIFINRQYLETGVVYST